VVVVVALPFGVLFGGETFLLLLPVLAASVLVLGSVVWVVSVGFDFLLLLLLLPLLDSAAVVALFFGVPQRQGLHFLPEATPKTNVTSCLI